MGWRKSLSWSRRLMDRNGRVPCKVTISHAVSKGDSGHTILPISYVCCMLIWMENSQLRRNPQAPFSVSSIIVLLILQSWCSTPLCSTATCWTVDGSEYVFDVSIAGHRCTFQNIPQARNKLLLGSEHGEWACARFHDKMNMSPCRLHVLPPLFLVIMLSYIWNTR